MLNEDKIKLMNEIATFEKHEGKKAQPAEKYFKSDYTARNMMQSFFSYTVCYILIVVVAMLYSMEKIVSVVNVSDVAGIGKRGIAVYIAGLVIYEVITWHVSSDRYDKAVRLKKVYRAKLNRLAKRYEFQDKTKVLVKEGGRNA